MRSRYGAEPGFITMNLPRLLDVLDALGIDNPIVCANINKIGFRMCGGIAAYEQHDRDAPLPPGGDVGAGLGRDLAARGDRVRVPPAAIESIVFGASSRANIRQTKALIDELTLGRARAAA